MTETGKHKTSRPALRKRQIRSRKRGQVPPNSVIHSAPEDITEEMPDPFDLTDEDAKSYLTTAPDVLKTLHRRLQGSGYKLLLGELLTDPRMKRAWMQIEKRLSRQSSTHRQDEFDLPWKEQEYEKLGREILVAASRRHRPLESRSSNRRLLHLIALDAIKLAEAIGDGPIDIPHEVREICNKSKRKLSPARLHARKPLDLLAYQFFPEMGAMLAFKRAGWGQLDPSEKDDAAIPILAYWPSMVDLLTELAKRAVLEAEKVGTMPRLVDRDRKRDGKQVELNVFLRHLYEHFFKPVLSGRMPGTLASIASVVLKREITKESVVTALRHNTK